MVDSKEPIIFPGIDGHKFRLQPGQQFPMLKEDDPEYMRPKMTVDANVKVFDMSKPADLKEYADVWKKATAGDVMISVEERHWCEATQNFKVFLRWGDIFMEIPKAERMVLDGQMLK